MNATAPAVPADPASTAERGPRPATATVAAILQLLTVLLAAALVAIAWLGYLSYDQLIDRAVELVPEADPDAVASERGVNLFESIMASVLLGGAGLWFGATLWPVWRGSNIARVFATIGAGMLTGLAILISCGGGFLGLMFLPLMASDPGFEGEDASVDPGFYDEDPFYDKLYQLQDSGAGSGPVLALGVGVLLLTLLAGALLVLLLVPPSNRWYAPRPPAPVTTAVPVYYPVYYPVPAPAAPPPPVTKEPPTPF